ncbi:hypothetical protein [uncultured Parabacteroides sp.]|jgi:hypothetical protein|uniref:hypothetical protein n=1 Tax=uncultured Parabacteroides sp. TaxID=512312 RepID=UPI0025DBB4FE|nr:hypothetical protein [uncultured Parabacteroides sp.]
MWNRLLIPLLLLLCSQGGFCQTWLNKTDKEILQYIEEHKERIQDSRQTGSLFTMTCQEEDELGRLFDVTYRFDMKDNVCTSYERLLPAHRYWAATLLEQASQQEADASGKEIEVDGETLNTVYIYDDYTLHISLKDDHLSLLYILSDI